jgi:hypothetical protein
MKQDIANYKMGKNVGACQTNALAIAAHYPQWRKNHTSNSRKALLYIRHRTV